MNPNSALLAIAAALQSVATATPRVPTASIQHGTNAHVSQDISIDQVAQGIPTDQAQGLATAQQSV